jgi:phosphoesterase RecJ-like protein
MMPTPMTHDVNKLNWAGATAAVEKAGSILLVTHMNPDGDAIGSLVALALALRERGKQVDAAVDDGVPETFRFLNGADTVLSQLTAGEWDLMISLDASDEERTGKVGDYGRANSKKVINVDHHPTNTMFGDIYLVGDDVVSTTEVLEQWFQHMNHPLSEAVAAALLTGLVTDTRGFRTSNVTAESLSCAQRLVAAGASLADISARTLDSVPYNLLELWKLALASMELHDGVVSANITLADRKQAKHGDRTDGGLVNLLLSADEAHIAIVFKEIEDNEVGISMRSKPGYDVSAVALSLGGGGHKQAAGATVAGTLDDIRAQVLPLLYNVANQPIASQESEA